MILVDSTVWIDHLRHGDAILTDLLHRTQVLTHPFVIGELALGSLRQRETVIGALRELPQAIVATDSEVMTFIESHALYSRGIGYVDAHLLAAARLTAGARLWTRDRRLSDVAASIHLSAGPTLQS